MQDHDISHDTALSGYLIHASDVPGLRLRSSSGSLVLFVCFSLGSSLFEFNHYLTQAFLVSRSSNCRLPSTHKFRAKQKTEIAYLNCLLTSEKSKKVVDLYDEQVL